MPTPTPEIKRYELDAREDENGELDIELYPADEGPWVRYEDALRERERADKAEAKAFKLQGRADSAERWAKRAEAAIQRADAAESRLREAREKLSAILGHRRNAGFVTPGVRETYAELAALDVALTTPEGEGEVDGAALIAAERRRQIDAEGWTPEHDDAHDNGELAEAAAAYALYAGTGLTKYADQAESLWPLDDGWNPSEDDVRNLVKAGALIAAEIDRLQRATGADCQSPDPHQEAEEEPEETVYDEKYGTGGADPREKAPDPEPEHHDHTERAENVAMVETIQRINAASQDSHTCDPDRPCEPNDHICKNHRPPASQDSGEDPGEVERWTVDYENAEGEPQHAVLSWLSTDPTKELPEVGTELVRLLDWSRAVAERDSRYTREEIERRLLAKATEQEDFGFSRRVHDVFLAAFPDPSRAEEQAGGDR